MRDPERGAPAAGPPEEPARDEVLELVADPPGEAADETIDEPGAEEGARRGPRLAIAIGSGKGGVGKSVLAASIGIYLAQLGKDVVLVDANLGAGNLHTLVGGERPEGALHHFLAKEVRELASLASRTDFQGLRLVGAQDDGPGAANPRPAQKQRLIKQLATLAADYVVVDLPPGTGFNALDLFLAADLQLVVCEPEPTAVESAFRMIKAAFARRVRGIRGADQLIADLRAGAHHGIPSPLELYELGREREPALGESLREAMAAFRPRLVMNKCRTREDLELGPALAAVGRRHLGLPIDYLGHVEHDDVVWVTVRRRRPLLVEYPDANVCKDIERVARRVLALETKESPGCTAVPPTAAEQTHYQLLGLHLGASTEDVRRAHRRVRRTYEAGSNAIYGIVAPAEVARMHGRIEEAYATLVDPDQRKLYNQRLFPEIGGGDPTAVVPPPAASEGLAAEQAPAAPDLPPAPPIDVDSAFSGDLIRRVREAAGVELQDLADRTKISISHLRAIEEERFDDTPAPVYLRGFVKAVARALKLDAEQVARTYMARYEQAKSG